VAVLLRPLSKTVVGSTYIFRIKQSEVEQCENLKETVEKDRLE